MKYILFILATFGMACTAPPCVIPECPPDAELRVNRDGSAECIKGLVIWKVEGDPSGLTMIRMFAEDRVEACCEGELAHVVDQGECVCWMSPCPPECGLAVAHPAECEAL